MTGTAGNNIAPDMGRLLIALPRDEIMLLSWTVSEYDGLGFIKTEDSGGRGEGEEAEASLFFPPERRIHVLELIEALKSEGRSLKIMREELPGGQLLKEEKPEEP